MNLSKHQNKGDDYVMDTLLNRCNAKVNGVITGFDRIVFKGILRPIMYAIGMQYFLTSRNVLNKDFKQYAIAQSKLIVESATEISRSQCNSEVIYIPSSHERKELLAHNRQKERGIKNGLIGVWSCVESCNTFRSSFNPNNTYPEVKFDQSRCKHLYFYFDDPTYGFMSIRLQTWAPYEIQIALNGREWLRRSLDARNCGYVISGNKFLHIDDYNLAQELLHAQYTVSFDTILNSFLPMVFPNMPEVAGNLSYYWTLWQSEVAKDYIFENPDALQPLMNDFQLYAMITGTGGRLLKYFGVPVKANGQPYPNVKPELLTRTNAWFDGIRVRHWNGKNSVKLYNEQNVLRFEMTMNDPSKYKIHRHSENQNLSEPKKYLPIRKGIADINVRAKVSSDIVDRFTEHMSTVKSDERLGYLLDSVCAPLKGKKKNIRALDVFGKDAELLRAISDPIFDVSAITNKELQKKLIDTPWAKNMSGKQLSGRISRHLSLLREHGLIKKLPIQHKYSLTEKGRKLTTSLCAAHASSVADLLKSAA